MTLIKVLERLDLILLTMGIMPPTVSTKKDVLNVIDDLINEFGDVPTFKEQMLGLQLVKAALREVPDDPEV